MVYDCLDVFQCVYVSVLCVASGALICHSPDDASADHNGYHVCSYVHGNSEQKGHSLAYVL